MAKQPAASAPAPDPAPAPYTKVTLKRAVTVEGHLYRPGHAHMVDATVLAAMGDAVDTSQPAA